MTADSTNTRRRSFGFSQKLRDLRPRKRRVEDNTQEQQFEIVHTPDRPTKVFSPVEAPTEDDCGSEIISWQLASAKDRIIASARSRYTNAPMVGQHSLTYCRRQLADEQKLRAYYDAQVGDLTELNHQDDSTEDCDDDGHTEWHPFSMKPVGAGNMRFAGGDNQQAQSLRVQPLRVQRQPPPIPGTGYTGQQLQHPRLTDLAHSRGTLGRGYEVPRAAPTPPAGGGAVGYVPLGAQGQVITPTPPPVQTGRSKLPATLQPPSGGQFQADQDQRPVDKERLARMEQYRRGICPFCRWFFGTQSQPLECPNPHCKRDLSVCLQYPTRRDHQRAPPRLADRPLINFPPRSDASRGVVRRKAVDGLRSGTPSSQLLPIPRPSPSKSLPSPMPLLLTADATRTTWPSPYEFRDVIQHGLDSGRDKPLPSPPQLPARSDRRAAAAAAAAAPAMVRSGSAPGQQHSFPRQHVASQMKTGSSSLSPSWAPNASSSLTSSHTRNASSPPQVPPPTSRYRGLISSQEQGTRGASQPAPRSDSKMDEVDFLGWKKPEERKMFQRQAQRKGDDADLFMDIIEQYDDSGMSKGGFV